MGSYENIVKMEGIRKQFDEGDFLTAQKVLDTLEWKKIKNLIDLNLIAEVYAENERYEDAAEVYHKIYDKVKTRKALFQLIEILIKLNDVEKAENYYQQYQKLAPRDFYNYIFRYKIDKIKGESFDHLIEILETLKKEEYTEKWAYELAKLYYKAGKEKECIKECSDIELWFGEGTYVEKAKILKAYYSGEANKDKIMEEIKRRAEVVNHNEVNSYIDQPINNNQEAQEAMDYNYAGEEYNFPQSVPVIQEAGDEFSFGLKQDINHMMMDEPLYSDAEEEMEDSNFGGFEDSNYGEMEDSNFGGFEDSNYGGMEDSNYGGIEDSNYEGMEGSNYYEENQELTEEDQVFPSKVADMEDNKIEEQEFSQGDNLTSEDDIILQQLVMEYQVNIQDIFSNFLHVTTVKHQLAKLLEDILHIGLNGNMLMITGAKGSGKTTLAKDMALFFYETGLLKSSRLAKIKSEKLNNINLISKKETLKDCCMVIEKASDLLDKTIDNILELMQVMQGELIVIFEEDSSKLDITSVENNKLMDIITNRIYIPDYTEYDYIGFAYACMQQRNYKILVNAEQKLFDKINQIVKQSEQEAQLGRIYDLMQAAMKAADHRLGNQLSNLASGGDRMDLEILTLQEEDFM